MRYECISCRKLFEGDEIINKNNYFYCEECYNNLISDREPIIVGSYPTTSDEYIDDEDEDEDEDYQDDEEDEYDEEEIEEKVNQVEHRNLKAFGIILLMLSALYFLYYLMIGKI